MGVTKWEELLSGRSYLRVLQRAQVQQVKVTRQRGAQRQEGAELRQLDIARGNHGDWRFAILGYGLASGNLVANPPKLNMLLLKCQNYIC